MKPVIVIGTGLSKNDLTCLHKKIIHESDILIGGIKSLEMVDEYSGRKVEITRNIKDIKNLIRKKIDYKNIVVLSSGDPLLFGIGSTLIKEFGYESIIIYPNISSISYAFSMIGEPWHDAKIISFHGRDLSKISLKVLFSDGDKFAILTDYKNTPKAIAKCLLTSLQENINNGSGINNSHIELSTTKKKKNIFNITSYKDFLKNYKFYIFERLGTKDEKISCHSILDVSGLDVSNLDVSNLDVSNLDVSNLDASNLDASNLDASNLDASNLDASNLNVSSLNGAKLVFKNPNLIILKRITDNEQNTGFFLKPQQSNIYQKKQDIILLEKNESLEEKNLNKEIVLYPGMPEQNFSHKKGLITKSEVRVVSLSKLRLLPEHVFWDLGAGSGSISIEASFYIKQGKIFAVEKHTDRVEDIKINKNRFNVNNLKIIHGNLPDSLDNLPNPDRVFIGGGGKELGKIIEIVSNRIKQGDIIVINTVLISSLNLAVNLFKKLKFSLEVVQLQVNRGKEMPKNIRFESENPVWIICGIKKGEK